MKSLDEIRALQVKICNQGYEHAFGQLYIACMPNLLEFSNTILKNNELAEEVVSNVVLKSGKTATK